MMRWKVGLMALVVGLSGGTLSAAVPEGFETGTPEVKSISSIAFGPDGILFLGDTQAGTLFAVATGDTKTGGTGDVNISRIDEKIASMLGTTAGSVTINDLKVNPLSGNLFLAASRRGAGGGPILFKLDRDSKLSEFALKDVPFASFKIPNASQQKRGEAITSLNYVEGKVIVAGLSNEEFASTLRAVPFPFRDKADSTSVEVFHGAHGKFETHAPVRTFVPYKISGADYLLAAYTCTPLVKFPVADLKPGQKIRGTTIAELGNRNRPLDMIIYEKDGKDYVLMANSARGVMKIPADPFASAEPITTRVPEKTGVQYETIEELKGVLQLDKLDEDRAVLVVQNDAGMDLKTVPLP